MADSIRIERFTGPIDATVVVPGSKSIANRALVCAALADGTSDLVNVPGGDDTVAMTGCLRVLGVDVVLDVPTAMVTGTGPRWRSDSLHAGLAGTTSRFTTALAALGREPVTIDGFPALRSRPFAPLLDALAALGVRVETAERPGHLPVTVCGPPVTGSVAMRGDVSSQYVTALMLVGPYLPGGLALRLTTPLVSRPYVEMTAAVMAAFGVTDVELSADAISVGDGAYRPATFVIEPDASSASYPLAVAAAVGGTARVDGIGAGSLQGDARFAELVEQMGCDVDRTRERVTVSRRAGAALHGIDVDMVDISDLVPTVAVLALAADSPTRIRGVGFIRGKESDRLGDLAAELRRLGADVTVCDDGLDIAPVAGGLHGATLATHHDHRLAMAFGVAGTFIGGVEVDDPGVVSKSWPGFWDMIGELRP